jgi:hypothetical protein
VPRTDTDAALLYNMPCTIAGGEGTEHAVNIDQKLQVVVNQQPVLHAALHSSIYIQNMHSIIRGADSAY